MSGHIDQRKPRLQHRIEYTAFRAALGALRILPSRAAEAVGAGIASLGYRPFGFRAGDVEQNLKRAFPEKDDAWRRDIAARAYAHIGREMVAMMRLSRMPRDELIARTEIVDFDAVAGRYRESGRGAVVIGGHFGNWEVGAAMMAARGFPISMVAQRQSNPLFNRHLVEARRRLGIEVIERGRAPKLALRALRDRRVVVFGADQNAARSGIFVPFFGHPASTHRGPALMAVRTRALVFLATPLRQENGTWRMGLEEVRYDAEGELDDVVHRLTAAFTAGLEAAIRRNPEQYLWHHRRWKTRPPQEPGAH